MQFTLPMLLGLVLVAQASESPFNRYSVFLDLASSPGGCSAADTEHFRNRAYSFRGWRHTETPLRLREGKATELNVLGTPEWETDLVRQSVVEVGGRPAVMLRFLAIHTGGTGSWGTVLIGTCNERQLTVVFEAESLGLTDAAFTADEVLVVKRLVWTPSDAHCCPSGTAEERYRWDPEAGRFVHATR